MKKCWGARGKKSVRCFCEVGTSIENLEKSVGSSGYAGSSVIDPVKNERGDE